MKVTRLGLLLAIFIMCLGGCSGTIRALSDDYADDYVMRNIRPTSGVSGEEVTFEMSVCENAGAQPLDGDDPPQVIWDFGTGAEPNVSYELNPQVMLRDGLRSPYECSVTLRGGCLAEDVYITTFTLAVAPLNALGVTPNTVVADGMATFSVVGITGNVTTYAWDFGGAAVSGNSNTANPSMSITGTPGAYQARVIIGNNFEAFEFPFTIVVLPAPEA